MNDLIVQQNIILICDVLKDDFNCNKKTKILVLMKTFPMKILHVQNDNHKKQFFSSKFSFFLEVVKFSLNDYKIFINN